ncbi:MAG TPA: hypothetical protein VKE95_09325 [Burkholderiales bacterium]|nr:hypothetical protein [Burkholderiales bacterium]
MKATALLAWSGLITVGLVVPLPGEARDPKSDASHPAANGESVTGGRAVDCDAAGAVMRALEKLRPGETLFISGVCAQNVGVSERDATIDALRTYRDRVTVRGATISRGRDVPSP